MPKRTRRAKVRKKWAINPKSRVRESKKIYSRKRNKKKIEKD